MPDLTPTPPPAHAAEDHHVPTTLAAHTGLKLGVSAFLVFVSLGVGFFLVNHQRSRAANALETQTGADAAAPATVNVVTVKVAPSTDALTLPGETRAWYGSTIYARVSGYLENWVVDIGDHVKAGQVLATIETPELDANLTAARAKLNAAEAEVNAQEAAAAFAKSTYDRWQGSPEGIVSEQERDSKKAEYTSSLARLAAAKAQVSLNQAEVQSLEALSRFKSVTAPYDGFITARHIDIGDLVTAGSTASTRSLFSIAQGDRVRVFVEVPQQVSAGFVEGSPATVRCSNSPDRKFVGAVARTSRSIDPVSRTLKVEVDVANPELALLPGMYVQVSFELAQKPLPQVPASALLFRASGPQVAVVGEGGRIRFHDVDIAHDQGDMVELRSGVAAGAKVVLNLSSQIGDGDKVTAIDLDAPASAGSPAHR